MNYFLATYNKGSTKFILLRFQITDVLLAWNYCMLVYVINTLEIFGYTSMLAEAKLYMMAKIMTYQN